MAQSCPHLSWSSVDVLVLPHILNHFFVYTAIDNVLFSSLRRTRGSIYRLFIAALHRRAWDLPGKAENSMYFMTVLSVRKPCRRTNVYFEQPYLVEDIYTKVTM